MITFSKKLVFFSCLLISSVAVAKKSHKLQLIIDPSNIAYFLTLNAGNGISHDPGTPRVQGSYYMTNAFIFPGSTVSKSQANFLVDKKGNPINLTTDNIGTAYIMENMVQALNLNVLPLPAEDSLLGLGQWQLEFRYSCDGDLNALFLTGFDKMGEFNLGEGKASFKLYGTVIGGLGCNKDTQHNNFTGKVYIGENGESTLIKIKFDEEIEYKD